MCCNAATGVIGMPYPTLTFDHNAINSLKKTVARRSSHIPGIALQAFTCLNHWGVCLCVNLHSADEHFADEGAKSSHCLYLSVLLSVSAESVCIQDILALGAIFATTDSVAVLQVLDKDRSPILFSLVFGEGVINDAAGVALLRAIQVCPQMQPPLTSDTCQIHISLHSVLTHARHMPDSHKQTAVVYIGCCSMLKS